MQSGLRLLAFVPIVAFLPACGITLRTGSKVTVPRGDPTIQGEVTAGIGGAEDPPQSMVTSIMSFSTGARTNDGRAVTYLDGGFEWAEAFPGSRWGYRASSRFGGALAGPSGSYLGLRGGPMVALDGRLKNDTPLTLSLEGIFNMGLGGDLGGYPMVGGALSLGWDHFGHFRVPSGRPLRGADHEVISATVRSGNGNGGWTTRTREIDRDLPSSDREILGAAWLEDARMEHASIASFSKLALDLLALGAPADLIERTHRAALDESRHARLCFAVANAYLDRDREIEPGAMAIQYSSRATTRSDLAAASLIDGCFGEGVAAAVARARARQASADPVIRGILRTIARDEARHAELGWSVLRWCVREGGDEVRERLASTAIDTPFIVEEPNHLAAHGVLDARSLQRTIERTRSNVRRRLALMITDA